MIGILDYGMGNLRSVQKAFERVGAQAQIIGDPDRVATFDRVILPGVGAFADGMEHLREHGLIEPIHDFVATGKPLMGICLGMQLLLDSSMEDATSPDAPVPGLSVLAGRVLRFSEDQGPGKARLKVPHMGWNQIDFEPAVPLFNGLNPGDHVYFVHGYYCQPTEQAHIAATTDYGHRFCSAAHRDNVWVTQFHPEKSQHVGLQILKNFSNA